MSRDSAREMRRDTATDSYSLRVRVCPPPIPLDRRTADDAVVWACPPPVMAFRGAVPEVSESASATNLDFQIDLRRCRRDRREDSTGWLSSLTVHTILFVLLTMVLSPADFGGIDSQPIYLSFARDDLIEPAATFEAPELENDANDEPLLEADPQPVEASEDHAADSADDLQTTSGAANGDGASGGDSAAHGSFFGIEARGHEFVYVLDMSGSMSGARYKSASQELLQSVEGLGESQKFYVLLFDDSTVQMFNESNHRPTPVAATRSNKDKLAHWLVSAYGGGGTDPRVALHLALRMKPSAIFMLSDGKFNKPKAKRVDSMFLNGDADAFSIVAEAHADVPIHAIAFEDPRSRENMKRLAQMTQGEYRFVESAGEPYAKEMLERGRMERQRGNRTRAAAALREVVNGFAQTESGKAARTELVAILDEIARDEIQHGNLQLAKDSLVELIMLNSSAGSTEAIQQKLVDEILQQPNDRATEITLFNEIIDRFPKSAAAQRIVEPLANAILEEARKLAADNQPQQAIQKLEMIVKEYSDLPATRECQLEQQRIIDQLLARARTLRENQDIAAAAVYLRSLLVLNVEKMNELATEALERLAVELIAGVRDAHRRHDSKAKNELQQQMDKGFANHKTLERMQREIDRKERKARELLRQANRAERVSAVENAIRKYTDIVDNYWGTVAAERAAGRLESLKPRVRRAAADGTSWELLDMVQP